MSAPSDSSKGALSAVTDADLALLRELGGASPGEGVVRSEIRAERDRFDERWGGALQIAAFMGDFDPQKLMPRISEEDLKVLLARCTVSARGTASRWRLRSEARFAIIRELVDKGSSLEAVARKAFEYIAQTGDGRDDTLSNVLLRLASRAEVSVQEIAMAGREAWAAYRNVFSALRGAGLVREQEAEQLLTNVRYSELLEPFRFLTGWDPQTGLDLFVGRDRELAQLRSFVDVLQSQSLSESVKRAVSRRVLDKGRAMVLSGTGGVGKSTLVAKFILQHAAAVQSRTDFSFAYLDFDRSTISGAQPATLLTEMLRQLSWQHPQLTPELDRMRDRIELEMRRERTRLERREGEARAAAAEGDRSLPIELVGSSSLERYIAELGSLMLGQSEGVALLVLDTFEEVQLIGDEAVGRVEGFLKLMLDAERAWRVLIVGRDEVSGSFAKVPRMQLTGFGDVASRRAFLEARSVSKAISLPIAKEAGGRPLALLLAARLVQEHGIESLERSFIDRFKGLFNERLIEGILYERILEHIPDKNVVRIVHPGLILRRLNEELITSILVPELQLKNMTPQKISLVMDALRRQKDLVRVEADNSVTHRRDVRAQMITLISEREPEVVERLHAAAARFYERKQDEAADALASEADTPGAREELKLWRIEELYHRLCLGRDLDVVVERWIPAARLDLARAGEEISHPQGQAALKIMLGRLPWDAAPSDLTPLLAREHAASTITSELASGEPETAMRVLERSGSLLRPEDLAFWLPLAFDRSGHWSRAASQYRQLLESIRLATVELTTVERWNRVSAIADFVIRASFQRSSQSRVIENVFSALASMPESRGSGLLQLQLMLRVRGETPVPSYGEWKPRARGPASEYERQWAASLLAVSFEQSREILSTFTVTDTVRRQLKVLSVLLQQSADPLDMSLAVLCSHMLKKGEIPKLVNQSEEIAHGYTLLMKHLMRPATPQWYVPLAALLREEFDGPMPVEMFVSEEALRLFPDRLPRRVSTTRSMADVFAQLDEVGLLTISLDSQVGSTIHFFKELRESHKEWRASLFPELDRWFDSKLRDHLSLNAGTSS